MADIEDRALDRLVNRLEMAIFQINMQDPDIEWRTTRG